VVVWRLLRLIGYTVFSAGVGGALTDALNRGAGQLSRFGWVLGVGLVLAIVGHLLTLRQGRWLDYQRRTLDFEMQRCLILGERILNYLVEWSGKPHSDREAEVMCAHVNAVLASNIEFAGVFLGDSEATQLRLSSKPTRPAPQGLRPDIADQWLALARQQVWLLDKMMLPLPQPRYRMELRRYASAIERDPTPRPWDKADQ